MPRSQSRGDCRIGFAKRNKYQPAIADHCRGHSRVAAAVQASLSETNINPRQLTIAAVTPPTADHCSRSTGRGATAVQASHFVTSINKRQLTNAAVTPPTADQCRGHSRVAAAVQASRNATSYNPRQPTNAPVTRGRGATAVQASLFVTSINKRQPTIAAVTPPIADHYRGHPATERHTVPEQCRHGLKRRRMSSDFKQSVEQSFLL